jgi:hypothetical protein
MSKKTNPFLKFKPAPQKAIIKALDDYEITYRQLTLGELDDLNASLIPGGAAKAGQEPEIDISAASDLKYKKVAMALIDPKVTVEELKGLSEDGEAVIEEILSLITPENELVDEEGK